MGTPTDPGTTVMMDTITVPTTTYTIMDTATLTMRSRDRGISKLRLLMKTVVSEMSSPKLLFKGLRRVLRARETHAKSVSARTAQVEMSPILGAAGLQIILEETASTVTRVWLASRT